MLKEQRSEQDLILLCINGDEEAFGELIEAYKPKLRSSMTGAFKSLTPADFDDCWQNAVIKAHSNLSSFRKDASFKTWLYTILKNEVLAIMRSNNKHDHFEVNLDQFSKFENTASSYDLIKMDERLAETAVTILEKKEIASQYKRLVENAIAKLDPNHSEILTKVLIEGKSYREVADELTIPIGTIMSRLFYARKSMQKTIRYLAQLENIELPCDA